MKIIPGGVTAPKGFEAAGVEAGIKYENRKDMALIYSQRPCVAAGAFTSNKVKAAPVLRDMRIVEESPYVRAVVVNTGIANAATGKDGLKCCDDTASEAAALLGVPEDSVLIGSTGVIGPVLPMERIKAGLKKLVSAKAAAKGSGFDAATAIMTTDTHPKEFAVELEIGGATVTIGAISKGSGMIHPDMCTMLSFVTTDAAISKEALTRLVKNDVKDTYNMISVDGDTSTNDSFIVLANGAAANPVILPGTPEYEAFGKALHAVNEHQAKALAEDGEGATKLIECKVVNAASKEDARLLARSVISSNLTKAAVFGRDANWGRIICALGYSGAGFDPGKVCLYFDRDGEKFTLYEYGRGVDFDEDEAKKILSASSVRIVADMNDGCESAVAWGCDLTYDYVKINGDYRS